jgi:hypothetical protein
MRKAGCCLCILTVCEFAVIALERSGVRPSDAGSMSWQSYVRFVVWMVVSLAVYCFYSIHAAQEPYTAVQGDAERLGPFP